MGTTTCITCGRLIQAGTGGRCSKHRTEPRKLRSGGAWTALSKAVRGAWVCRGCGEVLPPSQLEAHHLDGVAERPELFLDPDNVVALCVPCHRRAHHKAP